MGDTPQFQIIGNLRIYGTDGSIRETHNVICSGGLSMLRDYLFAATPSLAPQQPLYVAYGSGTQPVGRFMSIVPGETFRANIVQRDQSVGTPSVVYHWFLLDSDNSSQTVGSYGLIGGSATQSANTGTLFAIANEPVPYSKSPTTAYAGDWSITVSGVIS